MSKVDNVELVWFFSLSNTFRKGSNFHRFFLLSSKFFSTWHWEGVWPTFYLQLFSRSALQTHQQKIALIWQAFQAAFCGEPGISWKLERQGFYTMRLLCWNQTKLSTTRLPLRNANYKYISSYLTLTYHSWNKTTVWHHILFWHELRSTTDGNIDNLYYNLTTTIVVHNIHLSPNW